MLTKGKIGNKRIKTLAGLAWWVISLYCSLFLSFSQSSTESDRKERRRWEVSRKQPHCTVVLSPSMYLVPKALFQTKLSQARPMSPAWAQDFIIVMISCWIWPLFSKVTSTLNASSVIQHINFILLTESITVFYVSSSCTEFLQRSTQWNFKRTLMKQRKRTGWSQEQSPGAAHKDPDPGWKWITN